MGRCNFQGEDLGPEQKPCGPAVIDAVFSQIDEFEARTGATMYVGEWGIGGVVDFASHVAWLRAVRQGLDARGHGWSAWEQGELDKVFDGLTLEWNEELVGVLLDPEEPRDRGGGLRAGLGFFHSRMNRRDDWHLGTSGMLRERLGSREIETTPCS